MKSVFVLPAIGMILTCVLFVGIGSAAGKADAPVQAPAEPVGPEKEAAPAAPPSVEKGAKAPGARSYSQEAGEKLKRAAANLARSGAEFYVQPMEAKRQSGKAISMIWPGMGEACGMFLTRLLGGCIEGITFAVPFPNGWEPLLDE